MCHSPTLEYAGAAVSTGAGGGHTTTAELGSSVAAGLPACVDIRPIVVRRLHITIHSPKNISSMD